MNYKSSLPIIKNQLFRTLVEVDSCATKVLPESKLMFIGSCFTKNIGDKCSNSGLNTVVNPFGTVYNPISIGNQIDRLLGGEEYCEEDILNYNGLYHTFDHHSSFSAPHKLGFLTGVNDSLRGNSAFLNSADFLFITFGTAYAYFYSETGKLVANCHKYPSKQFSLELLSVDSIVDHYSELLLRLFAAKPLLKVVFSVSPIRHQRDGFHNSNLSKSTLLLSIQKLQDKFERLYYFPAYEIVLDELRDYRFFATDMLHLNDSAIDYIWVKFVDALFASATVNMMELLDKLTAHFNHKPFNLSSIEHNRFLRGVEIKVAQFKNLYPNFDVSYFNQELKSRLATQE